MTTVTKKTTPAKTTAAVKKATPGKATTAKPIDIAGYICSKKPLAKTPLYLKDTPKACESLMVQMAQLVELNKQFVESLNTLTKIVNRQMVHIGCLDNEVETLKKASAATATAKKVEPQSKRENPTKRAAAATPAKKTVAKKAPVKKTVAKKTTK